MSVYEAVIQLVGEAPPGFDVLVWIFSALILFYIIRCVFSIISSLLQWIGGQ